MTTASGETGIPPRIPTSVRPAARRTRAGRPMLISVVTTLYRSSAHLEEFYRRTLDALSPLDSDVEMIFVDDGSPDDSANVARRFLARSTSVTVVELSRNYGHHRAILAGLQYARGDLVFLIDCDLEEPPELVGAMYRGARGEPCGRSAGGRRLRRAPSAERRSLRASLRKSVLPDLQRDIGRASPEQLDDRPPDDRPLCRALLAHHERELFLGGLLCITGFRQIGIAADKKHKGSTSWTLAKKLRTAVQALTAFSARPLWFLAIAGSLISVASAMVILYTILRVLVLRQPYQAGWASIIVTISFFGGLNLLAIGIVGLYIAQIFAEVKARPCIVKDIQRNFAREPPTPSSPVAALEGARHA